MVSLRVGKDDKVEVAIEGESVDVLAEATYLMSYVLASIAKSQRLSVEKVVKISRKSAELICGEALKLMESPDELATEAWQSVQETGRILQ